ncbi:hypothetical protein E4U53_002945 [Claviceps sorghi]|nr:hypothetical protein E4U53_002945 [Claviceps sorghi]
MKGILKTIIHRKPETGGRHDGGIPVRKDQFYDAQGDQTKRCFDVDLGLIQAGVSPETRMRVLKDERENWMRQRRDEQLEP